MSGACSAAHLGASEPRFERACERAGLARSHPPGPGPQAGRGHTRRGTRHHQPMKSRTLMMADEASKEGVVVSKLISAWSLCTASKDV